MPYVLSPISSDISSISDVSTISSISSVSSISIPLSPAITTIKNIPTVFSNGPTIQFTPIAPSYYKVDVDTGLNDNYMAQKQMTEYMLDRILKYWIHEPEMKNVMKFMTVVNDVVNVVKTEEEYNKNDVSKDSRQDRKKKAEYIRENILGKNEMRTILIKIMKELGYKWKMFAQPREEQVVLGVTKKYIKKHLRENKIAHE
jgi:hypothetical protein